MIADSLEVGDLVIFNEKFKKHLYSPEKYEGIGVVMRKQKVHNGEIYAVYFNQGKFERIPRHWLIKMGCPNTASYCPVEEEWKLLGDI